MLDAQDLKPQNIVLNDDGTPKTLVSDVGTEFHFTSQPSWCVSEVNGLHNNGRLIEIRLFNEQDIYIYI